MIAAVAVAIIHDIFISNQPKFTNSDINSADTKVKVAITIVIVISTCSLVVIFSKILEKITQTIAQYKIQPNHITKNDTNHRITDEVSKTPFSIDSNIIKNTANAVQSLNKLSHSKISANLLGAHTSLNKAKTATGSVAEIKAPKSKQT